MIKGIIFDLDGTLLDTLEDIKNSMNFALEKYGYTSHTLAEYRNFIGNGALVLTKRSMNEFDNMEKINQVYETYMDYYSHHNIVETKPFEGIMEGLRALKQKGLKLAVLSNKPHVDTLPIIEHFFPTIFEVVMGSGPTIPHKPHPSGIQKIIKEMQLSKEEVVLVGDSRVDIQTGMNAVITTIAVQYGYEKKEELTKLNPNYQVVTPQELFSLLNNLINK